MRSPKREEVLARQNVRFGVLKFLVVAIGGEWRQSLPLRFLFQICNVPLGEMFSHHKLLFVSFGQNCVLNAIRQCYCLVYVNWLSLWVKTGKKITLKQVFFVKTTFFVQFVRKIKMVVVWTKKLNMHFCFNCLKSSKKKRVQQMPQFEQWSKKKFSLHCFYWDILRSFLSTS